MAIEHDEADRPARSTDDVTALPSLVRLDPPVPVEVLAHGEWWPGSASAYRGRRVSVSWSQGPGLTHLTWEPAHRVRRS